MSMNDIGNDGGGSGGSDTRLKGSSSHEDYFNPIGESVKPRLRLRKTAGAGEEKGKGRILPKNQ